MDEQKFSLRVSTDLKQSHRVQTWFDRSCASVVETDRIRCKLALIEAFTNVVRHAHEELPKDTPVDLEVILSPDRLELRIWDFGVPFDFDDRLRIALKTLDDAGGLTGGGRGLLIIYQGMDSVVSKRTQDGRNCLLMIKNLIRDDEEGERG